MAITWQTNNQCLSGGHAMKTTNGPALAVFNGRLYMVYVGSGGNNLWCAYLEPGTRTGWQENHQIKTQHGGTPEASDRPALAVSNGLLHMVHVGDEGKNLFWSWFDGNTWNGNMAIKTAASSVSEDQPEPALAELNGTLILAVHNHVAAFAGTPGSPPEHYTGPCFPTAQPGDPGYGTMCTVDKPGVDPVPGHPAREDIGVFTVPGGEPTANSKWTAASGISDGGKYPSLVAVGSLVYLLTVGGEGELKVYSWAGPGNAFPAATTVIPAGVDSSPAAAPSGGGLNFLYTTDRTFYQVWSAADGPPTPGTAATVDGAAILTTAPASMVYFDKSTCAAYKADHNQDIYLLSGEDYEFHPGAGFPGAGFRQNP